MKELEKLQQKLRKQREKNKEKENNLTAFYDKIGHTRKAFEENQEQLQAAHDETKKGYEAEKVLNIAVKLRKQALNNKVRYLVNEAIKTLELEGKPAYKPQLKKISDYLSKNDNFSGRDLFVSLDRFGYSLNVYADYRTIDENCYNLENGLLKTIDIENVNILSNADYIKTAKNLIKKEQQLNDKIKKIQEEVKNINSDLEPLGLYVSSYMDNNGFNFFR